MVLKGQILRGLGWAGALRVFVKALTLLKLAVLARILTPQAFGQFGVAALALTFFETMTETGVNQVLIYSNRKITDMVDSAWIVSIIRGVVVSLLIALSAYPLSWYFHDPQVMLLILLIAVTPLVRGFVNPMIVTFVKELDFRREFIYRGLSAIVDIVVAVTIGFLTHSAVAFVGALFVAACVDVAFSFALFTLRPRLRFVRSYLSEILGYGKWVTLAGVGHWIASELDDLVAGKLLGVRALGIYQASYKLSTLAVTEITGTVNQVAFPVLAKLKGHPRQFRSLFFSSFSASTAVGFVLSLLLWLFPGLVVSLLLGEQWLEAIPLIRYLAVFGFLRTIESSMTPLFLATGRPHILSVGSFLKAAVLAIGLALWARQGLEGISLAVVVSGLCVLPYYVYCAVHNR